MDQLSCIIVEDEVLARTSLERLCKKSDYLDLKSSFENGEDVGEYLKTHAVDLILLDIELPGISGIDLLEQLAFLPQIIFTTSNKEYAYEAYEYEITDFLKKPVTQKRFAKAIDKAIQIYQHQHEVSVASAQNEIYVKVDKKYVRLALEEIQYFENVGDYVKIVADSGAYVVYRTLKSIDERIQHPRFLKVHRSYIINLDRIVDIEDSTLVINKKVIPISRAHRPILLSTINVL